jgi:hypothetical protein
MLAKFSIFWHCKSEAEGIIFEKALLFQRTVSGKTTFTDRMFEWIQCALCSLVGKHYTNGFDNCLKQRTLMLREKSFFKFLQCQEYGTTLDDNLDPTNTLVMGKVYCETFKWFMEKEVWVKNGDKTLDVLSNEDGTIQINPQLLKT